MHLFIQALILGTLAGGLYALMVSGLTLSFGTMRVINMAQGVFVIIGAYVAYTAYTSFHINPFLAILIAAPLLFVVGTTLQLLLIRPLRYDAHRLSLLMTWAMAIGLEGILSIFYGTNLRSIITPYSNSSWTIGGYQFAEVQVFAFLLSAGVLAALYLLLSRTRFGRAVRATSQHPSAAKLLGVNTEWTAAVAFGISAATAGVGGVMYGLIYSFDPNTHYDLIGILLTIAILGGLGSYRGAAAAALVMGLSQAIVEVEISPAWASLPFYILLIIVLIVRPQGLFGVRERGAL